MNQPKEDDVSLLVVIIDINPLIWGERANVHNNPNPQFLQLGQFLEHFIFFINAYLMQNNQNLLCVIASLIGESQMLFPLSQPTHFEDIKNTLVDKIRTLADVDIQVSDSDSKANRASSFSGALSLALCYINRIVKTQTHVKARILVFDVSPDISAQYIPVMNCIFSAQKQGIPVDACILGTTESTFLQQASYLTGGIYIRPLHQYALSQYLLSCFLSDAYSRQFISLPKLKMVDFRASCFCHKKIIDSGYVCSVCLSIFCKASLSCTTCGTKFALPKMPDVALLKKKPPAAKPAASSTSQHNGHGHSK